VRISMNVGLTAGELRNAMDSLAKAGHPEAASRGRAALDKQLVEAEKR
jgi:hypothetical protein